MRFVLSPLMAQMMKIPIHIGPITSLTTRVHIWVYPVYIIGAVKASIPLAILFASAAWPALSNPKAAGSEQSVILRVTRPMNAENLSEAIKSLTPEEQESVRLFIDFLKTRERRGASPFLAAVNQFVAEHSELLRRLGE